MLVFENIGLVYLAVPKTATQSIRAALGKHASGRHRLGIDHPSIGVFNAKIRAQIEAETGQGIETVAVIRDPIDRLHSWFTYRQRPQIKDPKKSTQGISFETFLHGVIAPRAPDYAKIGMQSTFVGWDGQQAGVNHLFDYARLDMFATFMADRLAVNVSLPRVNVSTAQAPMVLGYDLLRQLQTALAPEFDLYKTVRAVGHLVSPRDAS